MRYTIAGLVFTVFVAGLGPNHLGPAPSAYATTKSYGCFKIVNASSVRIRKRPYLWSKTLDYAERGTRVVKNRRFCSIRRTWCRIRKGKTSGWVGKKFLKQIKC